MTAEPLPLRDQTLRAAARLARDRLQDVYDFRTEAGDLPFGTVDYYALEEVLQALDAALAPYLLVLSEETP